MARRRDSPLIVEIDTDGSGSGAPDDDGPAGAPEPRPSWFTTRVTAPVGARWRAVSRRTRVAVVAGTAAVAVLGTGAAVAIDHQADAALAAHVVTQPGGVADLSAPLQQTWRVETDGGVMTVLDGGLLVVRQGTEVAAVDAATGEVAWRHDLGTLPECGAGSGTGLLPLEPDTEVVCLAGLPDRTVTVIAADGEVLGERNLGAVASTYTSEAGGQVASLTGDGGIVVGDRVSVQLETADVEGALAELDERRAAGTWAPVSVRVEDALTGEVRGEATLDVTTADQLVECTAYGSTDQGAAWIQAEPFGYDVGAYLSLCGQSVMLGTDGKVLESLRAPFRDGYVTEDGGGTTTFVAADGTETVVDGWLTESRASDGRDVPLLAWGADGGLVAYADGEQAWSREGEVGDFDVPVTAGGTVVLAEGGDVIGLDAATGERLWTNGDLPEASAYVPAFGGALTDGRTGLLARSGDDGTTTLVALDLADGTVRWEEEVDVDGARLLAVEGHALLVQNDDGWSVSGDGDEVSFTDVALVGLAAP